MHSDPQISPQEIAPAFSDSRGAKIHRCCTDQFIRGKISDKMQRRRLNLTTYQNSGRYLISLQSQLSQLK